MRGDERVQEQMFSCVTLEQRVPKGLRKLESPLIGVEKSMDS
jgi:hypothetical protein